MEGLRKGVKDSLITESDDPSDDHHGRACIDWASGAKLGESDTALRVKTLSGV